MYETRKNMGDVHKNVSSAIEERKDNLSEEREHNRDSEQRQDETEFHIPVHTELGIEDYVVHDLRKVFSQEEVKIECKVLEHLGIIVKMRTYDKVYSVLFSNQELQSVRHIYGYIKAVCIEKFEKVVKRKE